MTFAYVKLKKKDVQAKAFDSFTVTSTNYSVLLILEYIFKLKWVCLFSCLETELKVNDTLMTHSEHTL